MKIKEEFAASEVRIAVHTHFRVSMICTPSVLLYLTWTVVLSRKQGILIIIKQRRLYFFS